MEPGPPGQLGLLALQLVALAPGPKAEVAPILLQLMEALLALEAHSSLRVAI